MSDYAVIVQNDESKWDDIKDELYHYPNTYRGILTAECKAIYYRGKMTNPVFSLMVKNLKTCAVGIQGGRSRPASGTGLNQVLRRRGLGGNGVSAYLYSWAVQRSNLESRDAGLFRLPFLSSSISYASFSSPISPPILLIFQRIKFPAFL